MVTQLNQQSLLHILQEVQKLGESNQNITSKDIVLEIEKMLLKNRGDGSLMNG